MVKKKLISLVLSVCFLLNTVPAMAGDSEPQLISTSVITAGAVLKNYNWPTVDGNVKMSVIECDLTNPYLKLDVITGAGRLTERSNVSAMAQRTGAVAAVNGDLYNTKGEGSPISTTVINGELVTSPCVLPGIYALGISADNKASIESFGFQGSVTAANGQVFPLSGLNKAWYWEFPVGVHSHLDKLHLYSDAWGAKTRAEDSYATNIAEVMVKDNKVTAISSEGYFDSAVPEGCYILRAQGVAKDFLLTNTKVGDTLKIDYGITPAGNWKTIIGGDGLLVDQGQMIDYTKDTIGLNGVRARTAAGISQDGNKVYLIGVEGKTQDSAGLTLGNLSLFISKIGIWRAVNLDGGGSTTMVTRPLGEFTTQQTFAVEGHAAERRVVEGVGVYSTAPKGALKGMELAGQARLLVGESSVYQIKAYDEYYNPLTADALTLKYADSNGLGTWKNNTFMPQKAGKTQITASSGGIQTTMPLEVLGKDSIKSMAVTADQGTLVEGGTAQMKVTVTLTDGTVKEVAPSALKWTTEGFSGTVSAAGVLSVTATNDQTSGKIIANYEGFTSQMTLAFNKTNQVHPLNTLEGLSFDQTPSTTTGELSLLADPDNKETQVVKMTYNFGQATDSVAAYLHLGANGLPLSSGTQMLYLDVYGSGHGEWLRAEVLDGSGNVARLDLTKAVDWQGWRQLSLDLGGQNLPAPLTLQRIYVVETANASRNQTTANSLLFKNLKTQGGIAINTNADLQLQIGSKQMYLKGQRQDMDVTPLIIQGRTMVPIRFVSEALGAQVLWQAQRETAVITYNGTVMELPINQKSISINGEAFDLDVAPQMVNDRTMVPLRAVSEGLEMQVDYQADTQMITITK